MSAIKKKTRQRARRKMGIRKRLIGDAERPRLTIFRSAKHIYAQIIDDRTSRTLCSASTRSKDLSAAIGNGGNIAAAKQVGAALAARAKEQNITRVACDRNGYKYHGRVKALADAAREAGLQF